MSRQNRYFEKFPFVDYKSTPAIDITKRVAFNSRVKNFVTAFYTYTLRYDDRIENLAFNYYDDVDFDWIIYHANDIIDPYYQVPLDYDSFEEYIKNKYGSVRNAKRKTIHYKNNYVGDDSVLSTSAYEAQPGSRKKYWQPVLSVVGIAGYERTQESYIASTNKIISFDITNVNGDFKEGEVIESTSNNSVFAEITSYTNTSIIVQHINGDFSSNTNFTIRGEESSANATVIVSTTKTLINVIPTDEQVYFSPVSCFDFEEQQNENRREIYLVDESYTPKLNKQLRDTLK